MKKFMLSVLIGLVVVTPLWAADKPPIYLWFEPEWFEGVRGSFAYWTGTAKPTGAWGVAGPGISPEWTQGGESEWNSMGVPATETKASCRREFVVPRAGKYKIWVRYVDHRKKTEPFRVTIHQAGKQVLSGELGVTPVVPVNDEYQLTWGFSFGWGALDADLSAGPARLTFSIDRVGEAWRQVDAVLLTDDKEYEPVGREKPPFAYFAAMTLRPAEGAAWRGAGADLSTAMTWKRGQLGNRDFSMWTGLEANPKWWAKQKPDSLNLYQALFQSSPPVDIRDKFHKQFAGRKDVPIVSWPGLLPGFYLGESPDLSPGTPLRLWLEKTKTPFYIMTNYASGAYTDKTGPATYAALTGPLAGQFLGYIHGEAIGTMGVALPDKALGVNRRAHVDAMAKTWLREQSIQWGKIYKTAVPESHWSKGIPCLSADSTSLVHLFHEMGAKTVGYEEDATNIHVPIRLAFQRGAARQYGHTWINYASGNFGDACNYFTQTHIPRGAPAWYHSRYGITDGVTAAWYRKLYYLNYLGGASAVYWEQNLNNQWILPGPGEHPIQLSPFGRATEDFQAFVDRLPDRGEPLTPIAFLLNYGHSYDRVNFHCKMLGVFPENQADRELRELFNVAWHPAAVLEGQPAAPDVQSMPTGVYGNVFDVLVDRPERAAAIFDYPIVWAAGDVELSGKWPALLDDYVKKGGTLVVNIEAARKLPSSLLGLKPLDTTAIAQEWTTEGGKPHAATPFEVARVELKGAKTLATAKGMPILTRYVVGKGAVLVTLVPRMLGQDERAHPALPYLMNGLTDGILPVEVRLKGGKRLGGEVMVQVNRTRDGYLVMLMNQRGLDKTPSGVARVDRRAWVDVEVLTRLDVQGAREFTQPRDLPVVRQEKAPSRIPVRVHPGDVQVIQLKTK